MTKNMLNPQQVRFLGLLFKVVVFSSCSLFLGWELVPQGLRAIIKNKITLSPHQTFYSLWLQPPIPVYFKIYIFNVTNPTEVEAGAKPSLVEVGPYVFQETRTKFNVTTDEHADTLTFWQQRRFEFRADLTGNLSLDEVLTIINVPFAAAALKIERDVPWPLNHMAHMILLNYKEPLFVQKTVEEMLFKGWRVPFLDQIESELGLTFVPNNTFGFFWELNNTDQGPFEISRGNQNWQDVGKMQKYKNESTLSYWGKRDSPCNQIAGTDGSIFPPLITKDQVLASFGPDLCTSMYLQYRNDTRVSGIFGYRFTLDDRITINPWEKEYLKCLCVYGEEECLPGGALDLAPCRDGAPIAITGPHFYNVHPKYLEIYLQNIERGVKPEKSKHMVYIDVEPWTGSLLRVKSMVQLNLIMKPVKNVHALRKVRKMLFPLVWANQEAVLEGPYAYWIWKIVLAFNSADLGAKFVSIGLVVALQLWLFWNYNKNSKEKKLISTGKSFDKVETVRKPEKSCSQDEELAERLWVEN